MTLCTCTRTCAQAQARAQEIAEFWVEHHKKFATNDIEYLDELIYSLEYARDFFKMQDNEQS